MFAAETIIVQGGKLAMNADVVAACHAAGFNPRIEEMAIRHAQGALVLGVAAGYVKVGRDRIERNPDQRVREALQLVFSKFVEFQGARQVNI